MSNFTAILWPVTLRDPKGKTDKKMIVLNKFLKAEKSHRQPRETTSKWKCPQTGRQTVLIYLFTYWFFLPRTQPCVLTLHPWDSPGENTRVGYHALLQGIFLIHGSNPNPLCLLHWQAGLLFITSITWEAPLMVLGWLKSLFGFFCKMLWKNLNKSFGQSNICLL